VSVVSNERPLKNAFKSVPGCGGGTVEDQTRQPNCAASPSSLGGIGACAAVRQSTSVTLSRRPALLRTADRAQSGGGGPRPLSPRPSPPL
jgi:hypothetical protein